MKQLVPLVAFGLVCWGSGLAQEQYSGPRPPKPDIPYLLHADNLIPTEVGEAREGQKDKKQMSYVIPGEASTARTPLAEPIFLFQSDKIPPESLQLFRLEVKKGNREVVIAKDKGRPLHLTVKSLGGRLYRIEVDENLGLENGEYSLSPEGSNIVFCFQEY
jgi:hypothetical protein